MHNGLARQESDADLASQIAVVRTFKPDEMIWVAAGTVKRLRDKGYTVTGEFTDEGGYRMEVTGSPT